MREQIFDTKPTSFRFTDTPNKKQIVPLEFTGFDVFFFFIFTTRWRDVVAVRRQLKRQMRGFPAAPCCVDPRFKLKALAPSAPAQPSIADLARGQVCLGNAGTLALSSTRSVPVQIGS